MIMLCLIRYSIDQFKLFIILIVTSINCLQSMVQVTGRLVLQLCIILIMLPGALQIYWPIYTEGAGGTTP